MTSRRPTGITVLGIFEVIFGTVGLTAGVVIIGLPAVVSALPRIGSLLNSLGLIIGIGLLFFSLIWLATGIGFLQGKTWGQTLGITFSVVSIAGAVGALANGLVTGGIGAIVFWSYMTYYLTRSHVKAFFRRGGLGVSTAPHLPYPAIIPLTTRQNATLQTVIGPNHSPTQSQNSKSTGSCPNCGSTLTIGSPKCLTCGEAI